MMALRLGALDDEEMDQLNNLISDKNVSLRFAAAVYLNETVLQSIPHIEGILFSGRRMLSF